VTQARRVVIKQEMSSTLIKWWCSSIFIVLCALHELRAQPVQLARYEIPLNNEEEGFEIIPAEKSGLYLRRNVHVGKLDQIHLTYLDTALNEKWKGAINIERNYVVFGQQVFQQKLHLLLRYRDYSRKDLLLVIVDNTGNYTQYNIKGYIPFSPVDFQVMNTGVAIGGYFNRTPLVLFFSLETYRSKVLPGLLNEIGELNQIKVNNDDTFNVLISAANFTRQKTIWIRRYDNQGNLISSSSLDADDNKHLIFGRIMTTENDMKVVAGVYGSRSTEYSRGVFMSSIAPTGYQQIRYYSFGDLENFFKYMKAKREKRVKERLQRRKIKGKKDRLNYRFLVHQVIPYKDQFLLLGEAFYPKYSYYDRSGSFFAQPRGIYQHNRVFEGYYYTHAVIMAFNKNGDLLWDNSFEINDVKTFKLEQFVKAQLFEDKIALFYIFDGKLRTKIIHNNEVLEPKTENPITTGNPFEHINTDDSFTGNLNYWYDNILVANGIQDVETPGGRHKRRVYFLNKIVFNPK
jgi:hypothetical protein